MILAKTYAPANLRRPFGTALEEYRSKLRRYWAHRFLFLLTVHTPIAFRYNEAESNMTKPIQRLAYGGYKMKASPNGCAIAANKVSVNI